MMEETTRRITRVNVYTNAFGTMLVYTSFFAGTMLMPIMLKDYNDGKGDGLGEQTAFYSMAVHCLSAAISCPFAVFAIKHFGTKIPLIVGSLCCVFFYIAMLFPNVAALYLAQSVFGFGLALVRPASLKVLIANSRPSTMGAGGLSLCGNYSNCQCDCDVSCGTHSPSIQSHDACSKLSRGRDSGIHWGCFMSSMIWGNAIVFFFVGDISVDHPWKKRVVVYAVLGSLNIVGTLLYMFLRPAVNPVFGDEERRPLLEGMKEDLSPTSAYNILQETFSIVVLKQTLWLIPSMLAAGFYFSMYCVEIPTVIGQHVALFGMMVGVGELVGSIVLGRLLNTFGYVLVTILSGSLAVICLLLTYTNVPKVENDDYLLQLTTPEMTLLIAVAIGYGVSDAGNNTALSTIIGHLFAERSEVIFCILSCMMNLAAMTWYFIYTVVAFETIIVATGLTVFLSMVGIFIVVRPK